VDDYCSNNGLMGKAKRQIAPSCFYAIGSC
jgi:hypothetical protein